VTWLYEFKDKSILVNNFIVFMLFGRPASVVTQPVKKVWRPCHLVVYKMFFEIIYKFLFGNIFMMKWEKLIWGQLPCHCTILLKAIHIITFLNLKWFVNKVNLRERNIVINNYVYFQVNMTHPQWANLEILSLIAILTVIRYTTWKQPCHQERVMNC
jgi:hypothetical protein